MALTHIYRQVPPASIKIERDERQRREIDTADLEESIKRRGVLNPIIVDERADGLFLVAGERRLTACLRLGLERIPCRYLRDMPVIERQIIELEENLKRKDLPWRDETSAIVKIHQLYIAEAAAKGCEWFQQQTADALGMDHSWISVYLRVGRELDNPRIATAPGLRPAYNILVRLDERKMSDAMSEILEATESVLAPQEPGAEPGADSQESSTESQKSHVDTAASASLSTSCPTSTPIPRTTSVPVRAFIPAEESILQESFLSWAPSYSGPKFNLLHCDFPYGISVFDGKQGGGSGQGTYTNEEQKALQETRLYDDSPEVYWDLCKCLCENLDRIMAHSAHLVFWLSFDHETYIRTRAFFAQNAPSLVFSRTPLVWLKSDNRGVLADPKRGPRHIYETALLASREDRFIVKAVSDAYAGPSDKTFHTSTKPEPMLRHFFQMLVDNDTRLLDPTCGSGSALRAAESLGARHVLGLELSSEHCASARTALKQFRVMRSLVP